MTRDEIIALQKEAKAFRETKVGGLLARFENKLISYWQADSRENTSDKRLRELADASDAARAELVAAIKELQANESTLAAPQPDAEGWIAHGGGPCPVAEDALGWIWCGSETPNQANDWALSHSPSKLAGCRWEWIMGGNGGDITHYRLAPEGK